MPPGLRKALPAFAFCLESCFLVCLSVESLKHELSFRYLIMAQTVNKTELAELQGVSLPTINAWMTQGMPVAAEGGRGKGYEFDNAAVTEWRVSRAQRKALSGAGSESEAASKKRKVAAEADIAEMKAAQIRGELCIQADLVADIQNDLAKVRARLLGIPTRAAPMVVALEEQGARQLLQELVHEALEELSSVNLDEFLEPYEHQPESTKKDSGTFLHSRHFSVSLHHDGSGGPKAPDLVNFSFV